MEAWVGMLPAGQHGLGCKMGYVGIGRTAHVGGLGIKITQNSIIQAGTVLCELEAHCMTCATKQCQEDCGQQKQALQQFSPTDVVKL